MGNELIARFADKYDLSLKLGTDAYNMLRSKFTKAYRDYCAAVLNHDSSLDSFNYSDNGNAGSAGIVAPARPASVPLRSIVNKFIAEELRAGNWIRRTKDQKRQHLDLLQEILGADRDAGGLSALDAQNVKELLLKYPKNRNKKQSTKDLSIDRLMELQGVETLTIRTVNSYLQTYSGMFGWAKRNQYVPENPFEGSTLRTKKSSGDESREAFSAVQVLLMLNEIDANGLGLIKKDYQKWGPLIGLYTGARLNEVSQVQLDDIKQVDGVWCIDLNDDGDEKRLKNAASKRLMPIHSKLIERGLLEHVESLRGQNKSRLFPEFSYSPKQGYGRTLA